MPRKISNICQCWISWLKIKILFDPNFWKNSVFWANFGIKNFFESKLIPN
jgi:hypothetical protein